MSPIDKKKIRLCKRNTYVSKSHKDIWSFLYVLLYQSMHFSPDVLPE